MKPADHPDFFRLPAPEGRSRESTIRLDALGRFWHDGQPVEHPGLSRAFASWVTRHPDDGRYILCNGYDWTYLEVEDVPCFVVRVEPRPGGLWVVLGDGSAEPLDPATLWQGPGGALYLDVRGGTLPARFQPAAQAALHEYLEEAEEGGIVLVCGSQRVRLPAGLGG